MATQQQNLKKKKKNKAKPERHRGIKEKCVEIAQWRDTLN